MASRMSPFCGGRTSRLHYICWDRTCFGYGPARWLTLNSKAIRVPKAPPPSCREIHQSTALAAPVATKNRRIPPDHSRFRKTPRLTPQPTGNIIAFGSVALSRSRRHSLSEVLANGISGWQSAVRALFIRHHRKTEGGPTGRPRMQCGRRRRPHFSKTSQGALHSA